MVQISHSVVRHRLSLWCILLFRNHQSRLSPRRRPHHIYVIHCAEKLWAELFKIYCAAKRPQTRSAAREQNTCITMRAEFAIFIVARAHTGHTCNASACCIEGYKAKHHLCMHADAGYVAIINNAACAHPQRYRMSPLRTCHMRTMLCVCARAVRRAL